MYGQLLGWRAHAVWCHTSRPSPGLERPCVRLACCPVTAMLSFSFSFDSFRFLFTRNSARTWTKSAKKLFPVFFPCGYTSELRADKLYIHVMVLILKACSEANGRNNAETYVQRRKYKQAHNGHLNAQGFMHLAHCLLPILMGNTSREKKA